MASNNQRPFSIKIFLPDGDPDGLRLIEKSNWTGVGVVFSRSGYKDALKREEFGRTGVYVLVGASDESSLPTIYVGEGDPVKPRLGSHDAQKDFWTWGVFFVTKDESLNKAHVKYLESRLIQLAREAKRCNLDNNKDSTRPNLTEADEADMESFLEDMLRVFPLLGLSVFEAAEQTTAPPSRKMLFIKAKGVVATGYESSKGFVVRKGSGVVCKPQLSLMNGDKSTRLDLAALSVIAPLEGEHSVFLQDYSFSSPSKAAAVVLGRNANGRLEWKDNSGKTLKKIQSESAESSTVDE